MKWTREDARRLRMGFDYGMAYRKLSKALGRSLPSAQGKLLRMGLRRKTQWTESEDATLRNSEAMERVASGGRVNWKRISAEMGRSPDACRMRAYQLRRRGQ